MLPDSVLKIQHFFRTIAYNIGGFVFTPDDIEHGILRGMLHRLHVTLLAIVMILVIIQENE